MLLRNTHLAVYLVGHTVLRGECTVNVHSSQNFLYIFAEYSEELGGSFLICEVKKHIFHCVSYCQSKNKHMPQQQQPVVEMSVLNIYICVCVYTVYVCVRLDSSLMIEKNI